MANMGYCRFTNTASDLADCLEWLGDNEVASLSEMERRAFKKMLQTAADLLQDYAESELNLEVTIEPA